MMHRASDSMPQQAGESHAASVDNGTTDTSADNSGNPTSSDILVSQTFPRTSRLLTPAAFRRVFSGGHRISARQFQLIALPHQQTDAAGAAEQQLVKPAGEARLGLTVAKRVAKRAVDRNRIKRFARETFRHQRHELAGLDLVLVARNGAVELTTDELHAAFHALWQRAAALKPEPAHVTLSTETVPVTTSRSATSP